MAGGLPLPLEVLPLGYLTNIIIGGLLTFAGFNPLASKIVSFASLFRRFFGSSVLAYITNPQFLALCWLVVLVWSGGVPAKVLTLGAVALMIVRLPCSCDLSKLNMLTSPHLQGLWFTYGAEGLRFYVLFIGGKLPLPISAGK